MMDKLMIVEDSLQNVEGGFAFLGRLPYYRGLGLSMIEDIQVTVDGETIARENIRFSVRGKTYTLDEMEHAVLRPLGDPRIHMAINCASRSCPPSHSASRGRSCAFAVAGITAFRCFCSRLPRLTASCTPSVRRSGRRSSA